MGRFRNDVSIEDGKIIGLGSHRKLTKSKDVFDAISLSIVDLKKKISMMFPLLVNSIIFIIIIITAIIFLVLALRRDPLTALKGIYFGAFGNMNAISETLTRFIPILITSLAAAIAFRCDVWNIGIEGQFWIGACITTGIGITYTEMPTVFILPLMAIASFLGGALWASIAGSLKVKFGINEIVTTIMLTGVATQIAAYLYETAWLEPGAAESYSLPIAPQAYLPRLIFGYRVHAGLIIALAILVFTYVLLWKTTLGYEIRISGSNPVAANYAGINVAKRVIIAMILSGGLSALAGMIETTGIHFRLRQGMSPGFGLMAVISSLLGGLHPTGIFFSSFLLSILSTGADTLQRTIQVPVAIVYLLQGLILVITLFSRRVLTRRSG